jgi:hypothetical protein
VAPVAGQPGDIERDLDRAKTFYRDGHLDEAVGTLKQVVSQLNQMRDNLSRKAQLADAHLHLGLSYFALRDESAALENFRQVVALDPDRTLDPDVYSPKVMSLFEQARSDLGATRASRTVGAPPAERDEGTEPSPRSEESAVLRPGTKVRLWFAGPGFSAKGNLLSVSDEAFTLVESDGQNLSFPRDTVTRVEVLQARKGHWLMGAIIGTALGAAIGAVETPGCGGNDGDCYTRGENIAYGSLGPGIVGALVGALYKTDRWIEVTLDRVPAAGNRTADRRFAVLINWRP